jgi:sulfate adenylyltransferase subunit 1 (EFTu-like GTPase family)
VAQATGGICVLLNCAKQPIDKKVNKMSIVFHGLKIGKLVLSFKKNDLYNFSIFKVNLNQ